MACFVSARDPYQGLYLFAVLPLVFKRETEFPSPALHFRSYHFSLKNQIMHPAWLKWAVLEEGPAPRPAPRSTEAAWLLGEPMSVSWLHRRVVFLQRGPSVAWGSHMAGRNTVHGPFEVFFINIQFPLTQRATQQSSPSWSCMPIICRLKLLQCASPQWALPYLEWACGTIVVIIWGLRDFNKKLWHDRS